VSRRYESGFTLIELLVVITVIAILAGLVAPMVFSHVGDAKLSAARAQIELFGLGLEAYRLDNDYYPSTAQGWKRSARARPGSRSPELAWPLHQEDGAGRSLGAPLHL